MSRGLAPLAAIMPNRLRVGWVPPDNLLVLQLDVGDHIESYVLEPRVARELVYQIVNELIARSAWPTDGEPLN